MWADALVGPAHTRPSALAPQTWLGLGLCASVAGVLLDRTETLAVLAALGVLTLASARPSREQWRMFLGIAALTAWAFVLGQGVFYSAVPRTPLVVLVSREVPVLGPWTGGVMLYREGLQHGLVQSLRLTGLLAFGLAACWSVSPQGLLVALTRLRIPYGVAFMAVTAFRFLPVVAQETATVAAVQRLRGFAPSLRHPLRTIAAWRGRLRCVLATAVRRAATLAMAIQARGFVPGAPRTHWQEPRLRRSDWVLLVGATTLTGTLAAAKALYALHVADVWHREELGWVYRWVREAL